MLYWFTKWRHTCISKKKKLIHFWSIGCSFGNKSYGDLIPKIRKYKNLTLIAWPSDDLSSTFWLADSETVPVANHRWDILENTVFITWSRGYIGECLSNIKKIQKIEVRYLTLTSRWPGDPVTFFNWTFYDSRYVSKYNIN